MLNKEINPICYVCTKKIKDEKDILSIGQNLYRHNNKCKPGLPRKMKIGS